MRLFAAQLFQGQKHWGLSEGVRDSRRHNALFVSIRYFYKQDVETPGGVALHHIDLLYEVFSW